MMRGTRERRSLKKLLLRIQSTQIWSISGFCIRKRNSRLVHTLHIWALGPLEFFKKSTLQLVTGTTELQDRYDVLLRQ